MDSSRAFRIGALLFAMFGVGWLAVYSRDPSALASEMWPVGLAAAAVFTARRREVPVVVLLVAGLAFATYVLGGRPLGMAIGGAVGVAVEAAVIATILNDGGRITPRLKDDQDLRRYISAVAIGGLVASGIAMLSLGLTGDGSLGLVGLGTLVGHTSSALFLLPWFMETDEHAALAPPFERALQWLTVTVLTVLVFLPDNIPAVLFMMIPALGWAALRLPLREVLAQLLLVATIGTFLTTYGFGPLAEAPDRFVLAADVTGILLQTFLIVCALIAIPFSMAVGQQVASARQARLERDIAQRIVDSANVAIIGADEIGRITFFNPAAQRLLGYSIDEVIGKPVSMLHTDAAVSEKAAELGVPDAFVHVALRMAEPDSAGSEIRFLRRDGTERTHSMTLSRIVDDRGRVTGYVSTSEDVTEAVALRHALLEALSTERRAVERLKEVDQVKDSFVSAVSHELRTPITSIVGYLEMLEDGTFGPLGPQQADAVGRVNANSRRLLTLIDELLTLSRVQDDGLGLTDREIDLRMVVRTAYAVVEPSWAHRHLRVGLELPDQPVPFTGDEDMLERVVMNLVSNAVKFTPDGGRVTVVLREEDGEAVLEVGDTGIGIPTEEHELLFTRFFRSSNAQRQAIPGSGLGLSIARAIVEMHGGRISVESEADAGTTFRVRLPSERLPAEQAGG